MFSLRSIIYLVAIFILAVAGHKDKSLKGSSTKIKGADVCDGSGGSGGHSPPICGHDKSPSDLVAFQSYEGVDKTTCCLKCTDNYPSCVCYTDDPTVCILYSEK